MFDVRRRMKAMGFNVPCSRYSSFITVSRLKSEGSGGEEG